MSSLSGTFSVSRKPLSACGWTFMTAAIPEGYRAPFRFDQPLRLLLLLLKTHQRIDSFVDLADFTALYSDDTDLRGRHALRDAQVTEDP